MSEPKGSFSPKTLFGLLPENDAWVRPYFGLYRKELLQALVLGVAMFAFAALLMFTSGYLISRCAERLDGGIFVVLTPVAFVQVFGLGKPILRYIERLVSHDWVFRMTSDLRLRLYGALESQAMQLRSTHRLGDFLGLIAEDIGHLQNLYLRTIFPIVIGWVLLLVVALFFGIFDLLFGLAILVVLLIVAVILPMLSVQFNAARIECEKARKNELYANLTDNLLGSTDWVFAGRGKDYLKQAKQESEARHEQAAALDAYYRKNDLASMALLTFGAVIVFVWAGHHFGGSGLPRADWIAAFVLGFFPLIEAFMPMTAAATQANVYRDSVARLNAYPRVGDEVLDVDTKALGSMSAVRFTLNDLMNQVESTPVEEVQVPLSVAEGATKLAQEGKPVGIEIDRVSFAHLGGHKVLNELSLSIAPGEKVAILGRSGSGKSTLASLIRGDLQCSAGSIRIDGTEVDQLAGHVHEYIGVVQQNAYLFNRTLRDNLRIGREDASDEEIWAAIDAVELTEMVRRLPKGLDTMVDEAGMRFSGGERHRIALARVLLSRVGCILLDEPTVGLDPITESALLDTLFKIAANKSLVMITHHLQDIERFDRVIFIEGGAIEMDGSPAELAQSNERFRALRSFDFGLAV